MTKRRLLTREAILGASDIQTEAVEVPLWGGSVLVRGLSVREVAQLVAEIQGVAEADQGRNNVRVMIAFVAATVVDEDGQRLFTEADTAALAEKSGAAIAAIFTVSQRLCGLDAKAAGLAGG